MATITDTLPQDRQRKNLLYDFYGPLLTEHQRHCFSLYFMEDCSLSEVAHTLEVTPQAVSDLLKRVGRQLEKYETKLGLLSRHRAQQAVVAAIATELEHALAAGSVTAAVAVSLRGMVSAALQ